VPIPPLRVVYNRAGMHLAAAKISDRRALIATAEIIAHAVLGIPVDTISPAALLSGDKFDEAGIHGVVEPDFFDWIIEVDGGELFVRTMARRLARFDWSVVDQDVLKVLYESIVGETASIGHRPTYTAVQVRW
jgi:hypothetical protein